VGIYYFAAAIMLLLLGFYLEYKHGGNNDKDKW